LRLFVASKNEVFGPLKIFIPDDEKKGLSGLSRQMILQPTDFGFHPPGNIKSCEKTHKNWSFLSDFEIVFFAKSSMIVEAAFHNAHILQINNHIGNFVSSNYTTLMLLNESGSTSPTSK